MPTYTFLDTTTDTTFEVFLKMSELDEFKENYPNYQQIIGAPNIVSGVSVSKNNRVPDGFKDVLKKVADAHPTSTLADRVGQKSIKQVKTERVINELYKKKNQKYTNVIK
jgi:hypothetical protein